MNRPPQQSTTSRPVWDAADYRRHSDQQEAWGRDLIARLKLRGDERVLDIGCGDGKVSAAIARCLPRGRVTGLDVSAQMVAYAQEHFAPPQWNNVQFVAGDAAALDFAAAFDVVFSNACLHWVLDHGPVLRGIARALVPGGRLLLQMGGKGNAAEVFAVLDEMRTRCPWRELFADLAFPYGFYGPDEYARWMHDAGLEPTRVQLVPKDMVHRGRAGLAGWIRTAWLPYTQHVPDDRREAFIEQLVDGYLAVHPLDADGQAHVAMVRLEAEGVRP